MQGSQIATLSHFDLLPSDRPSPVKFGYDATKAKNKRQAPTGILQSEDRELPPFERRKMVSASRDIYRNFSVAAWMIRRHLDYVTTFGFQARTGDESLNRLLEEKIDWWSRKDNFDALGRHDRHRFTRLLELSAVQTGDIGVVKLASGHVQAIEGDRIAAPAGGAPPEIDPLRLVHGVLLDDVGRNAAYCVCRRGLTPNGMLQSETLTFERMVPAADMELHGFWDRFDQVRGVTPLSSALNSLRDTYEGLDYALAKLKVAQLCAMSFYRGDPEAIDGARPDGATDYTKIPFGSGPLVFDLDVGDRVEFLESRQPSTEFQAFMQLMIQLVLKSLDIPYSFFSENFTNYSGARQALLQYEQAAGNRRREIRALLDAITAWRLALMIQDGELPAAVAPRLKWEWVATGLPWIDPLKEVQATLAALSGGLTSRTRALKEQGVEFRTVAQELADENALLQKLGLPTSTSPDNQLIKEMVDAPTQ